MDCPAGAVIAAEMATGLVTMEPSAGDGVVMVGAGGAGLQVMVTTFETSGTPLTWAVACRVSTPALAPWKLMVARPVASVTPDSVFGLAPATLIDTGWLPMAAPEASITATCSGWVWPTVAGAMVKGVRAMLPVGGRPVPLVASVRASWPEQHSL